MPKTGNKDVFWNILANAKAVLLTTHVSPDGDGIASELALYSILTSLGKQVYILNQDRTPEMCSWLPYSHKINTFEEHKSPHIPDVDVCLLVDCSSRSRIGEVFALIEHCPRVISLDHHQLTECFRDYCYVDPDASSIGEILFEVVPEIEQHLNRDIAECLYVSILTDTGSFAFSNTTSKVFRIASRLVECGVKPDHVFKMVYMNKRTSHFRLLARALETMHLDESSRVVYVMLPMSAYKDAGAVKEDDEGIIDVLRGLKNVELIILIKQLESQKVKVSLRSTNSINCNYLAKMWGGGGHLKASGFEVAGDIETVGKPVVRKILDEIKKNE